VELRSTSRRGFFATIAALFVVPKLPVPKGARWVGIDFGHSEPAFAFYRGSEISRELEVFSELYIGPFRQQWIRDANERDRQLFEACGWSDNLPQRIGDTITVKRPARFSA
jgi:hypothetical protein